MTEIMNIVEYDEFRSKMDEVKRTCDFIPDVSTKDGYDKSKRVALDVRKVLTKLEKTRKQKKDYFLQGGREVDSQAKAIKSELEDYMLPHDSAYKELDQLRKDREAARIHAHLNAIEELKSFVPKATGIESARIKTYIELAKSFNPSDFEEFSKKAEIAKADVLSELDSICKQQLAFEKQQEELHRLKSEAEERALIDRENKLKAEAKAEAERREREAIEREKKAIARCKEAEEKRIAEAKQAEIDMLKAVERARAEAEEKTKKEAAQIEAKKSKRAADQAHSELIRSEAIADLGSLGLHRELAEKVIDAICSKSIRHIAINY